MATKMLPFGVMVIEGDTHVSKWVEESGTLKIAEKYLSAFRKYIPVGGVVVDGGACIGDHTVTYADWVGENGAVLAFESNPEAYKCLCINTDHLSQVSRMDIGLSDSYGSLKMAVLENAGASHLIYSEGDIPTVAMDEYLGCGRLDFLKLDIEGFETRALRGGKKTIERFKPVMLIEVNKGALVRAGSSREELLDLIRQYGYTPSITEPKIKWSDPQYDVLCLP